jgi:cobyrinic acid a,c-diamide synthase
VRGRGLILAAPASGSGKTLLALGLLRHLRRRGIRVAAAKAGPDYIDPAFHAAALGAPSINLDLWAMREETLSGLVGELEESAEIVLCEGTMGLYDGTGLEGEAGSTAALARATGWPVVLVVDARGAGASIAALLRGFLAHDRLLPLLGVVFNRVRSPRHGRLLADATARHLPQLAVFGALFEDPNLAIPSRHLGLVGADEIAGLPALIDRAAETVGLAIDVERLVAAARSSRLAAASRGALFPPLGRRIAVARDQAFSFFYPALIEDWRRQGAALAFFSPLAGEAPEREADSIYLPGGYPELWAERLAAGERFLSALRQAAAEEKPIYGECGGYMVLGESLIDGEGRAHPMAGLLPLVSSFARGKRALGYRAARLLQKGPLGGKDAGFRGHEFHYATAVAATGEPLFAARDAEGRALGTFGLRRGSVCGSFIHLIDRSF